ncbi:MAG: DUF393 domain-containing protein [Saprospiraceae bacterium]|nr:DUF393 domain-containing protein [Saprospiraceae bacterium]
MKERDSSHFINRPWLIWDGTCGFCKYWTVRWKKISGDLVYYAPYQEVGHKFANITEDQFRKEVHLVEPDGSIYRGAAAALRTIHYGPKHWQWLYRWYAAIPWLKDLFDTSYVWVAKHRSQLYRVTIILLGSDPNRLKMYWLGYLIGLVTLVYFISTA